MGPLALHVVTTRSCAADTAPWRKARLEASHRAGAALPGFFSGGVGLRLVGVVALVGSGLAVYFPLVWLIGGMDKDDINALLKRRPKKGSDSV